MAFPVIALAALAVTLSACRQAGENAPDAQPAADLHNVLSAAEENAGWRLLFDGESTAEWRGYNSDTFPDRGWRVESGQLIVEQSGTEEAGLGGDIVTDESFASFELKLDFMLSDTANSGIFYRVIENPDEAIWNNAPEYQLLDDSVYIAMGTMDMTTHLTGDNYDLHAAVTRPAVPVGEWNSARIIVDGSHVEHWLNGEKTVEYEFWSPDWEARVAASKFAEFPAYGRTQTGPIGLQDHGHEVRFRNIKVRTLPAE